ncbi:MAG: hypothetical protein GY866_16450 [Proteobacteria bacterium]|nr:hypothetical protein [Pseudomonadota bacterium]
MSETTGISGWCGSILKVDLSTSRITQLSTMDYAERFLGGRGVAAKIYWDEVSPEIGAFDPENRLILMTGPLGAVGAQGASRVEVVSKSPMTLPEGYCYGSLGGYFGPYLKKAGFDGLVVSGRADRPCYLLVNDGHTEIIDAASFWGKGVYEVRSRLKEKYGEDVHFVTTGVAGENRCRAATLMTDQEGSATGGFGAVMGSKNLKAIAVLGTGKPGIARREEFNGLNRSTVRLQMDRGEVSRIGFPVMNELEVRGSKRASCYQCGLGCMRRMFRMAPDKEVAGKCQPITFYAPWVQKREGEPLETSLKAKELCNDFSLCSLELQYVIEWLEQCYLSEYLSEKETGLDFSNIGSVEFIERLVTMIARREGFGDILADGLLRMDGKFDRNVLSHFTEQFPGIGFGYDMPREYPVSALLYAMQPRGSYAMLHEISTLTTYWMINKYLPDKSPMDADLFRKVARRFWGSVAAWDLTSYAGKAQAAKQIQDRTLANESLVMCSVAWPMMISSESPDNMGDPAMESKLFSAVTGVETDEQSLHRYGERIFNLQRAILLREGWTPRESDVPEEFNFTRPVQKSVNNPLMIVPGPGEKPASIRGSLLHREKFEAMRDEYYRLRGWDPKTGLQKIESLERLDLSDVAQELKQKGLTA